MENILSIHDQSNLENHQKVNSFPRKSWLILGLLMIATIIIGVLSYQNFVISRELKALANLPTAELNNIPNQTQTTPTISVTSVPEQNGPISKLLDWQVAKHGGIFTYSYPSNWHVAELWPEIQGGPVSIVMDPNPISNAPGDGPLSKFSFEVYNGLPNPDEKMAELKAQFNPNDYSEFLTEEINSENGIISFYSGKSTGDYLFGTKIENYIFSLKKQINDSQNDPYNVQVIRATLMGEDQSLSEMFRQVVFSFKVQ